MATRSLINDDQAIVIHVRDKGLVVLTGFGHAGLINTLQFSREITGVNDICSVIGHLTGKIFEPIIGPTVDALAKFSPKIIVPQHCTGWRATQEISQQ